MWDRPTLKERAKAELKQSYPLSLGVSTVAYVIPTIVQRVLTAVFGLVSYFSVYELYSYMTSYYRNDVTFLSLLLTALTTFIVTVLASILDVGRSLYYINAAKGNRDFNNLFLPFTSGKFVQIAKTTFLVNLRITLWTLLFIVPGIIKSYEYRMVPFILAENPDLSTKEAIAISSAMTANEKMNIFVLDLSFLGWLILASILPYNIGILVLNPYIDATNTQLYEALKYKLNANSGFTPPPAY